MPDSRGNLRRFAARRIAVQKCRLFLQFRNLLNTCQKHYDFHRRVIHFSLHLPRGNRLLVSPRHLAVRQFQKRGIGGIFVDVIMAARRRVDNVRRRGSFVAEGAMSIKASVRTAAASYPAGIQRRYIGGKRNGHHPQATRWPKESRIPPATNGTPPAWCWRESLPRGDHRVQWQERFGRRSSVFGGISGGRKDSVLLGSTM